MIMGVSHRCGYDWRKAEERAGRGINLLLPEPELPVHDAGNNMIHARLGVVMSEDARLGHDGRVLRRKFLLSSGLSSCEAEDKHPFPSVQSSQFTSSNSAETGAPSARLNGTAMTSPDSARVRSCAVNQCVK